MNIRLSYFLFFPAILFIVGIFLASFFEIIKSFQFLFLILSFSFLTLSVLLLFFSKKTGDYVLVSKFFILVSFCFLFLFLGFFRFENYLIKDKLFQFRMSEERVEIEGVVSEEPEVSYSSVKYRVKVEPYSEYVLLYQRGFPEYEYGDRVLIKGVLSSPESFEDFDYAGFLKKEKILTVSFYPELLLLSKNNGGVLKSFLFDLKSELRKPVVYFLPSPQAEMLLAIALGDYGEIPSALRDILSRTGLVHIISISGMHITVIASILTSLFAFGFRLGISKSFYIVSFILIVYILMVGAPASAVRSGIMAFILLLSGKVGREYFASKSLLIACFLMLVWNPLLLKHDIGFQLSFLAVLGILYIAPIFKYLFSKISVLKSKTLESLFDIVSITLGVQLATFPLVIHNFGVVSVVSPLANALVVPATALMLIFGFLMMFFGAFSNFLGFIFFIPTNFIMTYVLEVAIFLDNLKLSSFTVQKFGAPLVGLSFFLISIFVVQISRCLKIEIKL